MTPVAAAQGWQRLRYGEAASDGAQQRDPPRGGSSKLLGKRVWLANASQMRQAEAVTLLP
jgi:hypothetical protein